MTGYISVYRSGEREILADIKKCRVYARIQGGMSQGVFLSGQGALDAVFAVLAFLQTAHIDYIMDGRSADAFPDEIFELWKGKALEALPKYPQLNVVGVYDENSRFAQQIFRWNEFFEKYGSRVLGTFKTPEEAEAFLDDLRGYSRDQPTTTS